MLPTSLRVRAKIRDMICKAPHDLVLLLLWPLVLSLTVLTSCWPPHCSSSRTGQSSPGLFFAFFPPGKALCSDSHPGHSLTSLRFHHTNVCPDHTASQWNPKHNPTLFFRSASLFFFSIIIFLYLTCYVSSWNLWFLPVHWDTILLWSLYWAEVSEDTFKGFSEAFSAPWALSALLQF